MLRASSRLRAIAFVHKYFPCNRGVAHSAPPSPVLTVGAEFSVERAFSADEISAFCALSGDSNPIHAAASAAGLQALVVPGILCASLFPAIIGSRLPGTIYLKQDLSFRSPALVGEAIRASVRVTRVSGQRAVFETSCRRVTDGQIIVDGTALALLTKATGRA